MRATNLVIGSENKRLERHRRGGVVDLSPGVGGWREGKGRAVCVLG